MSYAEDNNPKEGGVSLLIYSKYINTKRHAKQEMVWQFRLYAIVIVLVIIKNKKS